MNFKNLYMYNLSTNPISIRLNSCFTSIPTRSNFFFTYTLVKSNSCSISTCSNVALNTFKLGTSNSRKLKNSSSIYVGRELIF